MVGTVLIHNSDGKVMAPMGGGRFIEGKRRDICVTAVCKDEDLPLNIRQALVGVTLTTIFDSEQVGGIVPKGSRVAYGSEVAEALIAADKEEVAEKLTAVLKDNHPHDEYMFLVFQPGEFEFTG